MYRSHKKLLEILKDKDYTLKELAKITGYSPDGIRGRISEMKKMEHIIERIDTKYHLVTKTEDNVEKNVEKIIEYIGCHCLSGHQTNVERLTKILNIPPNEMTDALNRIYHQKQLTQWKKGIVIFHDI